MDDSVIKYIRKLAKKPYYQSLYSHSKELNLRLFVNDGDYTDVQMCFLNYLSFYHNLQMDVSMGEVDKNVFDDELYEDAYQYYKTKLNDKSTTKEIKKEFDGGAEKKFIFRSPKGKTK